MRGKLTGAGLTAILLCLAALAAPFQPPPAPTRWVTDTAGFLSEPVRSALDTRLERYERDTGRQVIVWIGESTGGVPLEEWAARTFEAWGIGKKGQDNGAAIFVFAKDRRLRIEVGYDLEPVVPDAVASRIIQEEAIPRLRSGNPDGAVSATVDALLRALGGETSPPPPMGPTAQPAAPRPGTGQLIVFAVLGLLLLAFAVTHPRMALFLLFQILSGGGGGAGGRRGGGGGFRGGGGRSGGGGASGSW